MLDSTRMRIVLLGSYGFSGRFIQEQVRRYDGESFSRSTIYKVVRDAGFRLKDYRDGENTVAQRIAENIDRRMPAKGGKIGTVLKMRA